MENPNFIFSSGPIELKEEGENFFVEGFISTSDLDLVNDIVTKDCIMNMAEQMKERTVKLDVEHESFRGSTDLEREINKTIIPVAKIDDFLVNKKGLKVRAMLNKHVSRFREVKNSIKDGFLDAFSIAFIPVESKNELREGTEVRMLDKINLLNVAFTGNPVNTHSTMTNVFAKSLEFLEDQKAKPKKPKPQPDPHKEPEDEEEEDEEEKRCKKPKKKEKKGLIRRKFETDIEAKKAEDLLFKNSIHAVRPFEDGGRSIVISDMDVKDAKTILDSAGFVGLKDYYSHENDTIKLQEVKNMTEDNKEAEEKTEAENKEKDKKKVEEEDEEKKKKKVSKKDEEPGKEEEESKDEESDSSTKEEVKNLKIELAEVKAIIKKPMLKSKVEQVDKTGIIEEKSLNPLDVIA